MFVIFSVRDQNSYEGGYSTNHAIVGTKEEAEAMIAELTAATDSTVDTGYYMEELNEVPVDLPEESWGSKYFVPDFENRLHGIIKNRYKWWNESKDKPKYNYLNQDYVEYLIEQWYEISDVVKSGTITKERMRYLIKLNIDLHGVN